MRKKIFNFFFALWILPVSGVASSDWTLKLQNEIQKIDQQSEGQLGVFILREKTGEKLEYFSNRPWYLASTTKVMIAVKLLQEVEKKRISLDKEITLQASDYVDGSGDVIWKEPGTKLKVRFLLEQMLTQSDSTATDMIIRLVGVESINQYLKENFTGFGEFTSLLQVRYDAYKELHPRAHELSNMDFIEFKKKEPEERHLAFAEKLKIPVAELHQKSVFDAFEKYYLTGKNSGSLNSFGEFLKRLNQGRLLSKTHTKLVLSLMEKMKTGDKRLKAGFLKHSSFAQKTGTQLRRICNVGILRPQSPQSLILGACAEKFGDQENAELALQKIGKKISEMNL